MSVSVGACAVMPGGKELGLVGCYCETMLCCCGKDNKNQRKNIVRSLFRCGGWRNMLCLKFPQIIFYAFVVFI